MKIKAIIVDDEPLARQRLRLLLAVESDVEICAECESGTSAVESVNRHLPDLMFLDVQMPEMDGFEVLKNIPAERMPIVVFTTAFEQHALRAFEAHALDYLLKPFKVARFQDALARARDHLSNRRAGTAAKGAILDMIKQRGDPPSYLTRLSVKIDDRLVFIKVTDIDVIEAAGKYVVIHVGKENHILRQPLSGLEEQLDPAKFLRISRSVMVNLDSIKELQPMFKGEHAVVLRGGRSFSMTRGLKEVEHLLKFS